MRRLVFISFFTLLIVGLQAQEKILNGNVSYRNNSNVYVRFESTEGIQPGDTLWLQKTEPIPALIVKNLSSISCVCTPLEGGDVKIGDEITARITEKEALNKSEEPEIQNEPDELVQATVPDSTSAKPIKPVPKNSGRISVSSYQDISNFSSDNQPSLRYRASYYARNIAGSKLSFESYALYKQYFAAKDDSGFVEENRLRIYNLSLSYAFSDEMNVLVGRKINPNISSLGALDGIQLTGKLKQFEYGVLAGSRPDWSDYSYNSKLFEGGAYLALKSEFAKGFAKNTLGFVQQQNNGNTDRRFLYFQSSGRYFGKMSVFASGEVDLYKLVNDQVKNVFNLSNLYVRSSYRFSRKFNMSLSYDARKNVVYYETYKSFLEDLVDREMRQGVALSYDWKILRSISWGARASYRAQKSDSIPTTNVRTYIRLNRIPFMGLRAVISGNYLQTSYLTGKIYGIRFSREFLKGKGSQSISYRYQDYRLTGRSQSEIQNNIEIDLGFRFKHKIYASLNYEINFDQSLTFNRLYVNLTKRF